MSAEPEIAHEDRDWASFIPAEILQRVQRGGQKAIPELAKDGAALAQLAAVIRHVPTHHALQLGDSRTLDNVQDNSVHLVITSPPYWTLKRYPERVGQMGHIEEYEQFLTELDRVWQHVWRVLVPGGRLVVVVGDVCVSRRRFGRHVVFPLQSSIQERCRALGFDNLNPIIWHKIANVQFEVENGSSFLGKPYEPNGIVKNDIEYILFQRKPGGYRQPTLPARILSIIPKECHQEWFQQIWQIGGASTRQHPAPFPLALAERLVRMFSYVGDIVLDPFMGTGTTNIAAMLWGRNSIGCDIEPTYLDLARRRFQEAQQAQMRFIL